MKFCYTLDTTVISHVCLTRDLGVCIDTEISLNQVMHVVNSSLCTFGVIKHVSNNFRKSICFLMLFRSLVQCHLEFECRVELHWSDQIV